MDWLMFRISVITFHAPSAYHQCNVWQSCAFYCEAILVKYHTKWYCGTLWEESPINRGLPTQRDTNAENVTMPYRQHVFTGPPGWRTGEHGRGVFPLCDRNCSGGKYFTEISRFFNQHVVHPSGINYCGANLFSETWNDRCISTHFKSMI